MLNKKEIKFILKKININQKALAYNSKFAKRTKNKLQLPKDYNIKDQYGNRYKAVYKKKSVVYRNESLTYMHAWNLILQVD